MILQLLSIIGVEEIKVKRNSNDYRCSLRYAQCFDDSNCFIGCIFFRIIGRKMAITINYAVKCKPQSDQIQRNFALSYLIFGTN